MNLTRTTAGLLLADDFTDLEAWSGDAAWTVEATPTLVTFGNVSSLLGPTADTGVGSEYDGIREAHLHVESDQSWYLLYDAGDGITGWRQFLAHSTDRGLTWERLGPVGMGLDNGTGGEYAATATGWLEKRGAVWYLHRVVTYGTFAAPDIGLPAPNYAWDIWTSPAPEGPWTFVRKVDPLPETTFSTSIVAGTIIKQGTTYYCFATGNGGEGIGYLTAPDPDGPWTAHPTALWPDNLTALPGVPEDSKVFEHPTLGVYVMLLNTIVGGHTEQTVLLTTDTLTSWALAANYVQTVDGPLDAAGEALGIASHVTAAEGALVHHDGYVPITYDGDPREAYPGWHQGRSILTAVLEPSPAAAVIADTSSTQKTIYRGFTAPDFVAEFAFKIDSASPSNLGFWYRLVSESDTADGYRLVVRGNDWLLLQKIVGGSPVAVQAVTTGMQATTATGDVYRLKVQVEGSRHRAWINGELQIDTTDDTYASGAHVALSSYNLTAEVRRLSVVRNDKITIIGLVPGQQVTLRAMGNLPVATVTANVSGQAAFVGVHGPLRCFEIDGVDHVPAGGIYPGDVYVTDRPRPGASLAGVR